MPVSVGDLIVDLVEVIFSPLSTGSHLSEDFHRWHMDRKTLHWPVASIKVTKRMDSRCSIALSYYYSVDKETYGGFLVRQFRYAEDAQRYYDGPGPSFARYDPMQPERSWISD